MGNNRNNGIMTHLSLIKVTCSWGKKVSKAYALQKLTNWFETIYFVLTCKKDKALVLA